MLDGLILVGFVLAALVIAFVALAAGLALALAG